MAGKGGARPNTGPKEGSVRPKFTHYWSTDDIQAYFDWLKENYKLSPQLAKFVGEQIVGKAVQPIAGEDGKPIQIQVTGVEIKLRK